MLCVCIVVWCGEARALNMGCSSSRLAVDVQCGATTHMHTTSSLQHVPRPATPKGVTPLSIGECVHRGVSISLAAGLSR